MNPSQPDDIPSLIGSLQRALTRRMISALKEEGFPDLTPAFAAIMPFINVKGSRQVAVAQSAGISKQAIGQLVRDLEQRGYVELVPDPGDARARLIRFTAKGLALRKAGFEIKEQLHREIQDVLGRQGVASLNKQLRRLQIEMKESRD